MDNFTELEYRGLNILDEISTVELAIDWEFQRIHVLDTNKVVEPEYHFSTKSYQLSEGFFKMIDVLNDKHFLTLHCDEVIQSEYSGYTWYFYGSRNYILKYEKSNIFEVEKMDQLNEEKIKNHYLYTKYIDKLQSSGIKLF